MLKILTVFPYGLSNGLRDDFMKKNGQVLLGSEFPVVHRKPTR